MAKQVSDFGPARFSTVALAATDGVRTASKGICLHPSLRFRWPTSPVASGRFFCGGSKCAGLVRCTRFACSHVGVSAGKLPPSTARQGASVGFQAHASIGWSAPDASKTRLEK
ncbi:hypothetical protein MRX96_029430 [Rhipicephalus microplus]